MSKQKSTVPEWAETNSIMIRAGFDSHQVWLAQIWAARDRPCDKCKAPPFVGCRNLVGIKNFGWDGAKENKFPHTSRIDFDKLKKALNDRGYQ